LARTKYETSHYFENCPSREQAFVLPFVTTLWDFRKPELELLSRKAVLPHRTRLKQDDYYEDENFGGRANTGEILLLLFPHDFLSPFPFYFIQRDFETDGLHLLANSSLFFCLAR
jgi:hypothetical protein